MKLGRNVTYYLFTHFFQRPITFLNLTFFKGSYNYFYSFLIYEKIIDSWKRGFSVVVQGVIYIPLLLVRPLKIDFFVPSLIKTIFQRNTFKFDPLTLANTWYTKCCRESALQICANCNILIYLRWYIWSGRSLGRV